MREVEVIFDGPPKGLTIAFSRSERILADQANILYWARPTSPDEISAVVRFVAEQSLPVSTIVIGELADYPLNDHIMPQWLADLAQIMAPGRVVVDTSGLDGGRRKRLVEGTWRACKLIGKRDPVAAIFACIYFRIRGWMR